MNSNQKGSGTFKPVIPKSGLVFTDKNIFNEIVCKPKLLPLKSLTLQKLEEMEKQLLHQPNTENVPQTACKPNYNIQNY